MKSIFLAILFLMLINCTKNSRAASNTEKKIRAVFQISEDRLSLERTHKGFGLPDVLTRIQEYKKSGIKQSELDISVVIHGSAAKWVLNKKSFKKYISSKGNQSFQDNQREKLIQQLQNLGVSVEVCNDMMQSRKWTNKDLMPGIKPVLSAPHRVIDLQLEGYKYVRF